MRSATTEASRVVEHEHVVPVEALGVLDRHDDRGQVELARAPPPLRRGRPVGVVICTGRPRRVLRVVAALDMQMLPTSPIVSRSASVSVSPAGSPARRVHGGLLREGLRGPGGVAVLQEGVDLLLREAATVHANVLSESSIGPVIWTAARRPADPGLGVEGVPAADAHARVGARGDAEGDDVAGGERQQVADVQLGVAELDGHGHPDRAELGGDPLARLRRRRVGSGSRSSSAR